MRQGDLEIIQKAFRLEGEDVIRISTGKALRRPKPGERMNVSVGPMRKARQFKLYRIKFALQHGYLPLSVDHRNRQVGDDALSNLRAATPLEQSWNKAKGQGKSGLPRGVYKRYRRFVAQATHQGGTRYLGTYATPEDASAAYQEFCRATRGAYAPVPPEA